LKYKQRNAFTADPELQAKHIEDMNVPVQERIKTLMVYGRCRLSPSLTKSEQYIVVNIPSFTLTYFKDAKPSPK
jgi:murein L,D-transpeptidase YcbB/YkuD